MTKPIGAAKAPETMKMRSPKFVRHLMRLSPDQKNDSSKNHNIYSIDGTSLFSRKILPVMTTMAHAENAKPKAIVVTMRPERNKLDRVMRQIP